MVSSHSAFAIHGTLSPIQVMIPLTILVLCLGFWGWMFEDMLKNADLPQGVRETWLWMFILLNVFAAAMYYASIYRKRR